MNDVTSKPSRRYIAHAIPYDGGWLAQYAFPGVVPRFVSSEHVESGQGWRAESAVYDSPEDAEAAAALALIGALNNRPRHRTMRERYRLMSGDDLTEAVRACGLTPTFACYLLGIPMSRFFQWVDEERDRQGNAMSAPHMARLLLALWQEFPDAIDAAEVITDSVVTERQPRKDAAE